MQRAVCCSLYIEESSQLSPSRQNQSKRDAREYLCHILLRAALLPGCSILDGGVAHRDTPIIVLGHGKDGSWGLRVMLSVCDPA